MCCIHRTRSTFGALRVTSRVSSQAWSMSPSMWPKLVHICVDSSNMFVEPGPILPKAGPNVDGIAQSWSTLGHICQNAAQPGRRLPKFGPLPAHASTQTSARCVTSRLDEHWGDGDNPPKSGDAGRSWSDSGQTRPTFLEKSSGPRSGTGGPRNRFSKPTRNTRGRQSPRNACWSAVQGAMGSPTKSKNNASRSAGNVGNLGKRRIALRDLGPCSRTAQEKKRSTNNHNPKRFKPERFVRPHLGDATPPLFFQQQKAERGNKERPQRHGTSQRPYVMLFKPTHLPEKGQRTSYTDLAKTTVSTQQKTTRPERCQFQERKSGVGGQGREFEIHT